MRLDKAISAAPGDEMALELTKRRISRRFFERNPADFVVEASSPTFGLAYFRGDLPSENSIDLFRALLKVISLYRHIAADFPVYSSFFMSVSASSLNLLRQLLMRFAHQNLQYLHLMELLGRVTLLLKASIGLIDQYKRESHANPLCAHARRYLQRTGFPGKRPA